MKNTIYLILLLFFIFCLNGSVNGASEPVLQESTIIYQLKKMIVLNEIHHPSGIQVHFDKLIIADSSQNQVFVTTLDGIPVHRMGQFGNESGEFNELVDAVSDFNHWVFALDRSQSTVSKFDRFGRFQISFGSFGVGDGEMDQPIKLSADLQGFIYVLDQNNHRIVRFDNNGHFQNTIGSFGSGVGFLSDPVDLAVDSLSNLYVLEKDQRRIQKFDRNGEYLESFDTLESPVALTVDPYQKRLYVLYSNKVQILNLLGEILDEFSKNQLENLNDLAVSQDHLYLLQGKKVYIFQKNQ